MLLLDGCASLHFFYRMCPSFSFLYFSRRNNLIRPSPAILHSLTQHSLLFHSSWLLLTVQFPTCFNIWTMMISQMCQVLWYFPTVYFLFYVEFISHIWYPDAAFPLYVILMKGVFKYYTEIFLRSFILTFLFHRFCFYLHGRRTWCRVCNQKTWSNRIW